MIAEHDLEDRLFLRRVQLEAELVDVVGEPAEDRVAVCGAVGEPGARTREVANQWWIRCEWRRHLSRTYSAPADGTPESHTPVRWPDGTA